MSRPQFNDLYSSSMYCKPELVQRIASWRLGIEHAADANIPSGSAPSTARSRNRNQKPYARPEHRLSARNSLTDMYVNNGLERSSCHPEEFRVQTAGGDGVLSGQVHYIAKPRRSYDLPDPERNPLVTNSQTDLEEAYSGVARLYKNLQEKKSQLEYLYMRQPSDIIMQQLIDVGASVQRLVNSAHYIISYSERLGLDINFATLIVRDQQPPYATPKQSDSTIKMPQPRPFSEAWKVNPL